MYKCFPLIQSVLEFSAEHVNDSRNALSLTHVVREEFEKFKITLKHLV